MIKLYAWTDWPNFGDALSRDVVEWATRRRIQLVKGDETGKLLAVGSILQHAKCGDVIWGTGVSPHDYQGFWLNYAKTSLSLRVLAVRGPITRDVLLARNIACPDVLGDPAILLPLVYPRTATGGEGGLLIPHLVDYPRFAANSALRHGLRIANPASDWREVVDSIVSAEFVVSSSLHGIIVAEAYGVPAIWFRPSHGVGYLKFQDYYGSTQRAPAPVYELERCLKCARLTPPDYTLMRDALLAALDIRLIDEICGVPD